MGEKFRVVDPRGILVTCSEDRWESHVIVDRPWMDDPSWVRRVCRAIEHPTFICTDADFVNRETYYQKNTVNRNFVKVVVQCESGIRNVVTAFVTDGTKKREKHIWP